MAIVVVTNEIVHELFNCHHLLVMTSAEQGELTEHRFNPRIKNDCILIDTVEEISSSNKRCSEAEWTTWH